MTLCQLQPVEAGAPARFKPLAGILEGRVGSLAAQGPHLLVGNAKGVVAIHAAGRYTQIIQLENVASIDFIRPDLCVASFCRGSS